MKSVLLFGANGLVGPYLAEELSTHGYTVYGSDIMPELTDRARDGLFAAYEQVDILDATKVESLISKLQPQAVINLAAISSVGLSWKRPALTMQINVVGVLNILEAVKTLEQLPKVMIIGSSEEYAPSDKLLSEEAQLKANNPYGISKSTQERFAQVYAEEYGMQIYQVRAFNHTGVGQAESFVLPSWCKQVAEIECSGASGVVQVGNVEVQRDFSDVRDVVRAYRFILESDYANEVFNVGSGVAYSLRELLQFITSFSSQDIEIQIDPERVRPTDNPFICCDNTKLKRLLGWEPRFQIKDTLREMFEDYKNQYQPTIC